MHLKFSFCIILISVSSILLGTDFVVAEEGVREIKAKYSVYPIEPRSGFEPSGLTIKNGQLFTVSDKHNKIFRLEVKGDVAIMRPHMAINASQPEELGLDLEGITVVNDDFYLISETHHRMLTVKESGELSWVPNNGSFYQNAHDDGLFQVFNASLEGVTYLGGNKFLMAAERQPRGLIEIQLDDEFKHVISQRNHILNVSNHLLKNNRTPDLTGLYMFKGEIFALHRNAELIHRWVKNDQGDFQETGQWSFASIVNAPEHQYQDIKYGHAEGLAVDDEHFYVVFDNNRSPKAKQGNDARPLLIVIDR